jgi:hypothetical protein
MGFVMGTGHRHITYPGLVKERLGVVLTKLKESDGDLKVISGGAEGADELLVQAAQNTNTPYKLYLPNNYYLRNYTKSVTREQVDNALEVRYSVTRGAREDWATAWVEEKWWQDNFKRNKDMIDCSQNYIVVSSIKPTILATIKKGGTSHAVRVLRDKNAKVIWVPDLTDRDVAWVQL